MNKKNQIFLFALLFLGLSLTSCQKENVKKEAPISRAEANKMVEDQRAKDVARIQHFVEKMQSVMSGAAVSARDGDLTIEEMAFGTEAVLNMYFASPENQFLEMDESISEVTVPILDGNINDADLLTAYMEVGQKMTDHIDAASYPNKKLVYADVVIKSTSATEATLEVRTAVGDRDMEGLTLNTPYFTKGWRCGETVTNDAGLKQWGDINYNETDKDAAKLFASTLNDQYRLNYPFPTNPYSCLYSYGVTEAIAPVLLVGDDFPAVNPNDPAANIPYPVFDNSMDYLFYKISEDANNSNGNYDSKKYLNVDEMNFYYSGLEETILGTEDPVWQANNASYFPEYVPLDSESWFVGWTFLSANIIAVELEDDDGLYTVHVPQIIYQQTIGTYCIPTTGGDDVLDAILELSELDWP